LLITGNAGVDAGYGGNLSTSAETPIPGAIWGFASAIGGAYLAMRNRKRKYKSAWDQKLIAA
jgi:hypothetical protein